MRNPGIGAPGPRRKDASCGRGAWVCTVGRTGATPAPIEWNCSLQAPPTCGAGRCSSCAQAWAPPAGAGTPRSRTASISARMDCISNGVDAGSRPRRNASISGAPPRAPAGCVRNAGRDASPVGPCIVSCCSERSVCACLRNCESWLFDAEHSAPDSIDENAMLRWTRGGERPTG